MLTHIYMVIYMIESYNLNHKFICKFTFSNKKKRNIKNSTTVYLMFYKIYNSDIAYGNINIVVEYYGS